ncbi:MAG: Na+/Ca+ antiporter, CaCA family [uncultured bacterium]|nr:MAG: Na+/Ca+ antiporter, CaCA family [uncultured bacterium]KKU25314.1 MAG: K+-dependent Na+/Ca+ exchanger family protein [Microgenomates group bacterium GW2011_GWA2_46_16]
MLLQITALIALCLILIYATSLIVRSIKTIARSSGLGAYGLTAFILAISTSLPELVVSLVASIEGNTSLILGNIIGSNIADLSLVIGGAALLGGSLNITGIILKRDIYLTGAAGFLPLFLIADGTLSRADGVVLLVIYFIMVTTFLHSHHAALAKHVISKSPIRRFLVTVTNLHGHNGVYKFIAGVALLLVSSHFIVQLASALALSTGLSTLFIGLFIVAIGTSLPELAFELKAVRSGQAQMALGDLLGSVVANSTLILAIAAIIRPLTLTHAGLLPYGIAITTFTLIYFTFTLFIKTKKKLEWWEGLILLMLYLIFVLFEITT